MALNKLSSPQLPTRKLNFQVLPKSLVIANIIIGAVTVRPQEPAVAEREGGIDSQEKTFFPDSPSRHSGNVPVCVQAHLITYTHSHSMMTHSLQHTPAQPHTSVHKGMGFLRGTYDPDLVSRVFLTQLSQYCWAAYLA